MTKLIRGVLVFCLMRWISPSLPFADPFKDPFYTMGH